MKTFIILILLAVFVKALTLSPSYSPMENYAANIASHDYKIDSVNAGSDKRSAELIHLFDSTKTK